MRRALVVAVLAALAVVPPAGARALALLLDLPFGTSGHVTVTFGPDAQGYAIAPGPAKRLFVAGSVVTSGSDRDMAFASTLTTGQPDTTFGGGTGRETLHIVGGGTGQAAYGAIRVPGLKYVVAGTDGKDFAVAKLTSTGAADPSFSGDGQLTTSFSTSASADVAFALARQPWNGRLVVVGEGGGGSFALARYTTTGSLDPSFGTGGKVRLRFRVGSQSAMAVLIQPDKKIVVAGYSFGASDSDFAVARFLPGGKLDTTFGTGGKVLTDFTGGSNDRGLGAVLQPDGKIVVCGESAPNLAVARYLANGTLDPAFGSGGKQTLAAGGDELRGTDCALDPAGNILVGGTRFGATKAFAVARFTPAGVPDTVFNPGGFGQTDFGAGVTEGEALYLQPDGKIVVAGHHGASLGAQSFALARFRFVKRG